MHKFLSSEKELENYISLFEQWKEVIINIRNRGTQEFLDLKTGDIIVLNGVKLVIIKINIRSLRVKRLGFKRNVSNTKRIETIPIYLNAKYRIISRHEAAVMEYFDILHERYGESCLSGW